MQVRSLGWEDLLEEEMATHYSILTWRIPRTEEPGRLQSTGSHKELDMTKHAHDNKFVEENCPFPIKWSQHPCQRSFDHICEGGNQTLLENADTH